MLYCLLIVSHLDRFRLCYAVTALLEMGAGVGHSALGLIAALQLFGRLPTRVVAVELDVDRHGILHDVLGSALNHPVCIGKRAQPLGKLFMTLV